MTLTSFIDEISRSLSQYLDSQMSIGLPQGERRKLERTLHSTNDLPVAFFKPAQVSGSVLSLNCHYFTPRDLWIVIYSIAIAQI